MNTGLAMKYSIINLTFSCTFGIIYTRAKNARYIRYNVSKHIPDD